MSDLMEYLQQEGTADVFLVGNDGKRVPASRFLLGARCQFFHAYFHRGFAPPNNETSFDQFSSTQLEAVVEYCVVHPISMVIEDDDGDIKRERVDYRPADERSARDLVLTYCCADFFGLSGLQDNITETLRTLDYAGYQGNEKLHLICAIFDEAVLVGTDNKANTETTNKMKKDALGTILRKPEETLFPPISSASVPSGVALLSVPALQEILCEDRLFGSIKLQALKKWKEHSRMAHMSEVHNIVVHELLPCIDLSCVEESCLHVAGFVPENVLEEARSRKYVLVEKAQTKAANGRYYEANYDSQGQCYIKEGRLHGKATEFSIHASPSMSGNGWTLSYRDADPRSTLHILYECNADKDGDVPPKGWTKAWPDNHALDLTCTVVVPSLCQ